MRLRLSVDYHSIVGDLIMPANKGVLDPTQPSTRVQANQVQPGQNGAALQAAALDAAGA